MLMLLLLLIYQFIYLFYLQTVQKKSTFFLYLFIVLPFQKYDPVRGIKYDQTPLNKQTTKQSSNQTNNQITIKISNKQIQICTLDNLQQNYNIIQNSLTLINFIFMEYRQKTNSKLIRKSTKEELYQSILTQQHKIETENKLQILPYILRKVYLFRLCDFFHNLKFFYEYSHNEQEHSEQQEMLIQQQKQSHSINHHTDNISITTQQMLLIKTIWRLYTHRTRTALEHVKQQANLLDEESLTLSDNQNNIESYMRMLKLRQEKRMDLAIEGLDSVLEKNTRRKLLEGFINIKQQHKRNLIREVYHERSNIISFVDVCDRVITRRNDEIIREAFVVGMYEEWYRVKAEEERRMLQEESRKRKIKGGQDSNKNIYKKDKQLEEEEQSETDHKNTANKYQRHNPDYPKKSVQWIDHSKSTHRNNSNIKQTHSTSSHVNQIVTNEFRQHIQRISNEESHAQDRGNSNEKSSRSRSRSRSRQFQETGSEVGNYYFKEQSPAVREQKRYEYGYDNEDENQFNNMSTKRESRRNRGQQQQQHKQQLHQPHYYRESIVDFEDINSENLLKHPNYSTSHNNSNNSSHPPVTQRIQKNYYEVNNQNNINNYYQQDEQQSSQQQQAEGDYEEENVIQQIYVIRNHIERPRRKPDQFVKVPIMSEDINIVEIPSGGADSHEDRQAKYRQYFKHKASSKAKTTCANCQYCLKVASLSKTMKSIMEGAPITTLGKAHSNSAKTTTETTKTLVQTHQNIIQKSRDFLNHSKKLSSSSYKQFERTNPQQNHHYYQINSSNKNKKHDEDEM